MIGPVAPPLFWKAAGHQRNVFALASPRLGMTSFDVMDGTVLGFGPTQSGLTIRAGRDPLVLVQLLLTLPSVFKKTALLVLFVFGEHSGKIGHTQI